MHKSMYTPVKYDIFPLQRMLIHLETIFGEINQGW